MIRCTLLPLFLLTASSLWADSIKLKSGETIEGTVTSETRDAVTIEVPFSATIMDTRVISKADIETMDRQTKDQRAFIELTKLENLRTALNASGFENIRLQIETFIQTFPNSAHLADARALLAKIEEREARFAKGEVKVNGEWLSAEEYAAEKYQIEAAVIADEMQRATAEGNPVGAMNLFDELKKSFPHSTAFAGAVETAKTALADLERRLAFEMGNLQTKLAERARTIELTAQADRERVRIAMEAEDARLKRIAEQAAAAGRKFFPISSIDANGLKLMQNAVAEAKRDLAKPDYAALTAKVAAANETIRAVAESNVDAARAALANLESQWAQFEALPRLKAKLAAMEARLTAPQEPTATPAAAPNPANTPTTPPSAPAPAKDTIGL
jgi:hypothetical protein